MPTPWLHDKIAAYLRHNLTLDQLVNWAERTMMDGGFEEQYVSALATVIARLGVADVRAFGLSWEDFEQLLQKIGYAARVEVVSA